MRIFALQLLAGTLVYGGVQAINACSARRLRSVRQHAAAYVAHTLRKPR